MSAVPRYQIAFFKSVQDCQFDVAIWRESKQQIGRSLNSLET